MCTHEILFTLTEKSGAVSAVKSITVTFSEKLFRRNASIF